MDQVFIPSAEHVGGLAHGIFEVFRLWYVPGGLVDQLQYAAFLEFAFGDGTGHKEELNLLCLEAHVEPAILKMGVLAIARH